MYIYNTKGISRNRLYKIRNYFLLLQTFELTYFYEREN